MVTRPTAFVVGAGASVPYGLPTGVGLLRRFKSQTPADPVYPMLLGRGANGQEPEFNELLNQLNDFEGDSLDAFLQTRPDPHDLVQRAGRAAIAALMGYAIKTDLKPAPAAEDWLVPIVHAMVDGVPPDEFSGNRVSFVTFNFDSVIEKGLESLLRDHYGSKVDSAALTASVPIYHVHGHFPQVPSDAFDNENGHWVGWLYVATDRLRTVYDASVDPATLARARHAIAACEVLCFLGFGYHIYNLDRLDISSSHTPTRRVFGSTYEMSDSDRQAAAEELKQRQRFAIVTLAEPKLSCRQVVDTVLR